MRRSIRSLPTPSSTIASFLDAELLAVIEGSGQRLACMRHDARLSAEPEEPKAWEDDDDEDDEDFLDDDEDLDLGEEDDEDLFEDDDEAEEDDEAALDDE